MYIIVTENEKEVLELLKKKNIKVMAIEENRLNISEVTNNSYKNISEFLLALGIKPHIKGFKYLEYIFENKLNYSAGITKVLYPTVADAFDTTPSRVERAIRHAIETAITNASVCELYTKLFGNFENTPTNHQFIEGCKVYLKNNPIG